MIQVLGDIYLDYVDEEYLLMYIIVGGVVGVLVSVVIILFDVIKIRL